MIFENVSPYTFNIHYEPYLFTSNNHGFNFRSRKTSNPKTVENNARKLIIENNKAQVEYESNCTFKTNTVSMWWLSGSAHAI